jgi:FAD binding domain
MDTEVFIVGAGLVLALWLARLRIRVRIVDKAAEPGTTSRALAVQARTLELYRQLGFADDVVEAGLVFSAANLWAGGRKTARLELGALVSLVKTRTATLDVVRLASECGHQCPSSSRSWVLYARRCRRGRTSFSRIWRSDSNSPSSATARSGPNSGESIALSGSASPCGGPGGATHFTSFDLKQ